MRGREENIPLEEIVVITASGRSRGRRERTKINSKKKKNRKNTNQYCFDKLRFHWCRRWLLPCCRCRPRQWGTPWSQQGRRHYNDSSEWFDCSEGNDRQCKWTRQSRRSSGISSCFQTEARSCISTENQRKQCKQLGMRTRSHQIR